MATTTLQQPALPPGPRPLPFVGNILEFRRDQLGYLQRLQQTYGNMATIYIGKIPIVLLFRPEHVRYVLTENPRNFTSREVAEGLRQLIGDGLITIDGETHREQRRRVQPAFHKKRVESYVQTMVQFTEEMLEKWQAGTRIDVACAMQELTLRIVAKCLFNVDLSDQVNRLGGAFTTAISCANWCTGRWCNNALDASTYAAPLRNARGALPFKSRGSCDFVEPRNHTTSFDWLR